MDIRFCLKSDITHVMRFLNKHWAENHVLSKNRELMDWQYSGTQGRDYDFIAAFDGENMFGCLSFIRTSRFDPALAENDTIWLTLWQTRNDAPGGLGLQLLAFLRKHVPHRSIGTIGFDPKSERLYRALGYKIGCMTQHYVLHPKLTKFTLAVIPEGSPRFGHGIDSQANPRLQKLDAYGVRMLKDTLVDVWPENATPRKSLNYYISRFINHPFYNYGIYAIEHDGRTRGLLVLRVCDHHGVRALRLVDAYTYPDALRGIAKPLQVFLETHNIEYADLYQTGLDDDAVNSSGLLTLNNQINDVIIPSYFEPFRKENIMLCWSYRLECEQRVIAFKADCDQDRPSQLD